MYRILLSTSKCCITYVASKDLTAYFCVLVANIIFLNKSVYWLSDWITNQTTKLMEQSPFWKANISWSSQTFPVLYGIQYSSKCLEEPATCPCPEPGQPSPCCLVYFLKLNLNIIHQFTPSSSKWLFDLRFPHQNPVCTPPFSIFATCFTHLIHV